MKFLLCGGIQGELLVNSQQGLFIVQWPEWGRVLDPWKVDWVLKEIVFLKKYWCSIYFWKWENSLRSFKPFPVFLILRRTALKVELSCSGYFFYLDFLLVTAAVLDSLCRKFKAILRWAITFFFFFCYPQSIPILLIEGMYLLRAVSVFRSICGCTL